MKKLKLFICCSLDGYIAKPDDDLSFLKMVESEDEDYGYQAFTETIDTVVVGRRTYEWVISKGFEFPHQDKQIYIVTHGNIKAHPGIMTFNGNPALLVSELKKKEGKDIYCDGGADVVSQLLKAQLFDELTISVIPILLGDGKPLFEKGYPVQELILLSSKQFPSGLVQLNYRIKP